MRVGIKQVSIAAVAAIAIFATTAEASSSGDSSSAPAASSAASTDNGSTAAASEAPAETGPGIGEEARDGKFAFTVSNMKCGVKKVGNVLDKKAQGQFCLVTMSVKNIGDESQLFDAGSQKGLTNTGATVDADGTASLYANEDADTFLNEINPGNSLNDVVVVYDIAKDQTLDALELHDSIFSDGVVVSTK